MCSFEGAGKESTRREDSIGVLSVGFPKREESKGNGIILDSSMVEHTAVNRGVVGSSPTRGARQLKSSCPKIL